MPANYNSNSPSAGLLHASLVHMYLSQTSEWHSCLVYAFIVVWLQGVRMHCGVGGFTTPNKLTSGCAGTCASHSCWGQPELSRFGCLGCDYH
jgi:hypothetical protein